MRLVIACLVAALPARSFRVACGRARWATRAGAADPTAYEASEPSAADPITTVLCTELAVDASEAQSASLELGEALRRVGVDALRGARVVGQGRYRTRAQRREERGGTIERVGTLAGCGPPQRGYDGR